MKSPQRLALCLFAFTAATLAFADDIRVDVVVDVTPAGKKVPKPTPDHPAYYVPVSAGYKEIGPALVHYQRPSPPDSEVTQSLVQALAPEGYLPATKLNPPSLVLVYGWGYVAPQLIRQGKRLPPIIANENVVLPMIAGDNTEVHEMNHMSPWLEEVIAAERHPRYYLVVTALDYQSSKARNPVVLWRAHVTVPLWGHYLDQVLETLISAGAPQFGQQSDHPQMGLAPIVPLGQVIVGTPTVKPSPSAQSPQH